MDDNAHAKVAALFVASIVPAGANPKITLISNQTRYRSLQLFREVSGVATE